MTKVVLVVAPFLSLPRPAIGISLLQAALAERGIACDLRYLNLEYADFEGPDFGQPFCHGGHLPLGEWVFSHLVNGPDDGASLDRGWDWVKSCVNPRFARQMKAAKGRAAEFVDRSARSILEAEPDHVGFSSSFQQNCASLSIAHVIKTERPEVVISFGGANCMGPMGRALLSTFQQIDYVFSGEADETFPDFIQRAAEGEVDSERYIAAAPITNMDALPIPTSDGYFAALDRTSFKDRIAVTLPFESSRGCWWGAKHHCVFCGLNADGMGFRSKSPKRVVDEVRHLSAAWNNTHFAATDNIMDIRHVEGVFSEWREALSGLKFFYEIKANLSVEQLRTIAAAGVVAVQPGIESLNDGILKLMSKGVRALQNVLLLRTCREIGIGVYWAMLSGFPRERPEHYAKMARMIPLLQHFDPPTGLRPIRIDRFSPYHNNPQQLGFSDVVPLRAYREIYDLPSQTIADLVSFFEGTRDDGPMPDDYLEAVECELQAWYARAHGGDPARLSLVRLGPFKLVRDTRDCAVEAEYVLPPDAEQVLHAFDRPSSIERRMAELDRSWQHERHPESCFRELVDHRFMVLDEDRAVHVAVDPDRRIEGVVAPKTLPAGALLEIDSAAKRRQAV